MPVSSLVFWKKSTSSLSKVACSKPKPPNRDKIPRKYCIVMLFPQYLERHESISLSRTLSRWKKRYVRNSDLFEPTVQCRLNQIRTVTHHAMFFNSNQYQRFPVLSSRNRNTDILGLSLVLELGIKIHTVARKLGMTTGLLKKCVPTGTWATVLVKLSNFMQQIGQHKGRKMPRKIEEKLVTTHRSVAILHTILVYIAN